MGETQAAPNRIVRRVFGKSAGRGALRCQGMASQEVVESRRGKAGIRRSLPVGVVRRRELGASALLPASVRGQETEEIEIVQDEKGTCKNSKAPSGSVSYVSGKVIASIENGKVVAIRRIENGETISVRHFTNGKGSAIRQRDLPSDKT